MYCHLSGTFQLDRKTDDYKNVTKTKHCNTLKHPPDSIWKLSISDKKSGNAMSVENPDQFIYSWVHYRLTYYKRKDRKKKTIHNEGLPHVAIYSSAICHIQKF